MSKLISYFEYNNIKYYISLLDNKRIIFLKSDKTNKFSSNLSNKEKELIKKVYNSLIINIDKSIYIKNTDINNNTYSIFFDSESHKYFWLPITYIYNEQDNKILNFKYNHEPEIIYSQQENSNKTKKTNFYTKFIKIGSKLIPIFISSVISLTLLTGCTIPTIKKNESPEISVTETIEIEETKIPEEIEITNDYNYEQVRQAITNNPNLTKEEKEFIYKLQFIFDENNQYMDLDLIVDRLSNLKIYYGINLGGADAAYDLSKNIIYSDSQDFTNIKKATFLHEFLHVLQDSGNSLIGELSTEYFTQETMLRIYKEGLVEKKFFLSLYEQELYENGVLTFENEVDWLIHLTKNNRFASGYSGYDEIYFILSEILSPETIRQYQFNPSNIEILTTELTQIDNKENINILDKVETAYQLISSINELRIYSPETNSYSYSNDLSTCCKMLDYYYQQKNKISLAKNLKCSIHLQLDNRFKENINTNLVHYLIENYNISGIYNIIPKTNLSNVQDKTLIVYYDTNGETKTLEITDEINVHYQYYQPKLNASFKQNK